MFLLRFDVLCALSEYRQVGKWNLSVNFVVNAPITLIEFPYLQQNRFYLFNAITKTFRGPASRYSPFLSASHQKSLQLTSESDWTLTCAGSTTHAIRTSIL